MATETTTQTPEKESQEPKKGKKGNKIAIFSGAQTARLSIIAKIKDPEEKAKKLNQFVAKHGFTKQQCWNKMYVMMNSGKPATPKGGKKLKKKAKKKASRPPKSFRWPTNEPFPRTNQPSMTVNETEIRFPLENIRIEVNKEGITEFIATIMRT